MARIILYHPINCPPAPPLFLDSNVCAHHPLPGTTGTSGAAWVWVGMILSGPEFLEGLPPCSLSWSSSSYFIHPLRLTASSSCPLHSFLKRTDFRFPSDMENASGIWGIKQVDRVTALKVTQTELTHNSLLGQAMVLLVLYLQGIIQSCLFFLKSQLYWDLMAVKLPPIWF